MENKGQLFVICAPSGAGKTSLVNKLIQQVRHLHLSISFTTRPKRSREKDGANYFFLGKDEFERLRDEGKMLEWAEVFGNYYGTSKEWVDKELAKGIDIILEIDWQGAEKIRESFPDCIQIFILPPSIEALRERITKRAQDDPEVIERRLSEAHQEMSQARKFDYIIVNDRYAVALSQLKSIIYAERVRTDRQIQRQSDLLIQLDI